MRIVEETNDSFVVELEYRPLRWYEKLFNKLKELFSKSKD